VAPSLFFHHCRNGFPDASIARYRWCESLALLSACFLLPVLIPVRRVEPTELSSKRDSIEIELVVAPENVEVSDVVAVVAAAAIWRGHSGEAYSSRILVTLSIGRWHHGSRLRPTARELIDTASSDLTASICATHRRSSFCNCVNSLCAVRVGSCSGAHCSKKNQR
jgi:hypothetical protein